VREGILANGKAIALWPRNHQPRDNVIRALVLIGELDEAAKLYREWLAEEPDNEVVKHHLAACLNQGAPERASDKYVETVFDRFSSSFDAKLQHLQYRAPEYVTEALGRAAGEPKAALDIADAGCGTGLCGPLVKPWARTLVGFDLSAGMLDKAKPREVYDELHASGRL
jgi:predicted TPR repeat methyltransferase